MEQSAVYVSLEFTPNPNTLKYSVNRMLLKTRTTANFGRKEDAEGTSPLAAKLFAIEGIRGVMIGKDFVTVTKTEEGDWDVVHKTTSQTLESHLGSDEVVVNEDAMAAEAHEQIAVPAEGGDTEVVTESAEARRAAGRDPSAPRRGRTQTRGHRRPRQHPLPFRPRRQSWGFWRLEDRDPTGRV